MLCNTTRASDREQVFQLCRICMLYSRSLTFLGATVLRLLFRDRRRKKWHRNMQCKRREHNMVWHACMRSCIVPVYLSVSKPHRFLHAQYSLAGIHNLCSRANIDLKIGSARIGTQHKLHRHTIACNFIHRDVCVCAFI